MQELDRWPIFSLLDEEFLASLRIACVFGSAGNEALVVTRDDDVYALGSNGSSCLGVGDAQSCLHPRKVEALCKKNVVSMACGSGPHVLAVSGTQQRIEKYANFYVYSEWFVLGHKVILPFFVLSNIL